MLVKGATVKRGYEQYSVSKFIAYMGKVLAGQRENIYSLYEHIHKEGHEPVR